MGMTPIPRLSDRNQGCRRSKPFGALTANTALNKSIVRRIAAKLMQLFINSI